MSSSTPASPYTQRYIRYAKLLGFFNLIPSIRLRVKFAKLVAPSLSPDVLLDEKILNNLAGCEASLAPHEMGAIVEQFHRHACIGGLDHISRARKSTAWLRKNVVFDGIEALEESLATRDGGVLVLTYHNHYKFLLPVTLGLRGHSVSALAIDYKLSEVYQNAEGAKIYQNFFSEIESYWNGGQFIYINGQDPIKTYKKVLKSFGRNKVLVSLNDVYSPLSGTRNISTRFLGKEVICPTGTIETALQKTADIYSAHIQWSDEIQGYKVIIEKLDTSSGVENVAKQYMDNFANVVTQDPAIWEGWKLL